jgi:hypothetical protein
MAFGGDVPDVGNFGEETTVFGLREASIGAVATGLDAGRVSDRGTSVLLGAALTAGTCTVGEIPVPATVALVGAVPDRACVRTAAPAAKATAAMDTTPVTIRRRDQVAEGPERSRALDMA